MAKKKVKEPNFMQALVDIESVVASGKDGRQEQLEGLSEIASAAEDLEKLASQVLQQAAGQLRRANEAFMTAGRERQRARAAVETFRMLL